MTCSLNSLQMENLEPKKVDRFTRTKRYQRKKIYCPKCGIGTEVGHFSWSELGCSNCNAMVNKYEWLLNSQNSLSNES